MLNVGVQAVNIIRQDSVPFLKFRSKIEIGVAVQVLRVCWQKKKAMMDQRRKSAKVCRIFNVVRPDIDLLS